MAERTQFRPDAIGGMLYGEFGNKQPSTSRGSMGQITQFHPDGFGGMLYGAFDGKEPGLPGPDVTAVLYKRRRRM